MSKSEIKTVLIAVAVVIALGRFEATRGLVSGGNRFFN